MQPTTVRIVNFRSIESSTFSLRTGINVLVGPNGAGKTNILQGLKFLTSILRDGAAVAMGRAGGPSRNFRRGANEISFIVVTDYETSLYDGRQTTFYLRWQITLSRTDNELIQVSSESVDIIPAGSSRAVIQASVTRTQSGQFRHKVSEADVNSLTKKMVGSRNSMSKEDSFKAFNKSLNEHIQSAKKSPSDASILPLLVWLHPSIFRLAREISSFDEYNIQPEVARAAADPLPVTKMGSDGRSVSEVISALESQQFQRIFNPWASSQFYGHSPQYHFGNASHLTSSGRSKILDKISEHLSAAVTSIDSVSTSLDPSTGKRFVVFNSGNHQFRPEEISDGTMKWLCLLVAILAPQSKVIILEEPENFMHPWMQQRFVQILREQSQESKTSIILTTHSATILNALEVDDLLIVSQQDGLTSVRRVEDQDSVIELLKNTDFGLGDMWVSGAIGAVSGGN